jgi:molybdate transport system substrate-binding protein
MTIESLKLLSSMATREILAELVAAYSQSHGQAHGQSVVAEAGGGVDIAKRVQAGEAADIVVLAGNAIDKLIAEDKLIADSRVDLMKSGVAVAVKQGAPTLDISNEAAVKRAVQSAASLSYSTGPSGVYLEKLFERWGILAEIKPRIVVPPPGVPVGTLVARGEVALGFQQLSELMNLSGITVLGPLPPEIQTITTFTGAVAKTSQHADAARKVLAFMAAPTAQPIMQRCGMESASH